MIAVGYNDFEDQYAGNIQDALAALKAAGVKHVWWLTLRAAHHPYVTMNADIEAAAQQNPQMTVVDWNVYSRSHPDWFQLGRPASASGRRRRDGDAHPLGAAGRRRGDSGGARRDRSCCRLRIAGRAYHARLVAAAGIAPYRWSLLERAPAGIHLEPNGAIDGIPRAGRGRYVFTVQVRDAAGSLATRHLTLRIN